MTTQAVFLDPKIAVPTLTMVAPSSIATSKSRDIPIESTRAPGNSATSCADSAARSL